MTTLLTTLLTSAAIGYAGLIGLLYLFQNAMVFPGAIGMPLPPAAPCEEHMLPVDRHLTCLWYWPAPNARGVVLYSHGNAENISDLMPVAQGYAAMGFSTALYDYGGYGKSTGASNEKRCYADIRAVWQFLTRDKGVAPNHIILHGRSLGGGVAAQLAAEVTPAAIILESTFASTPRLAQELFPWAPARHLITNRFDTESKLQQFTAPLLVAHSPQDTVIPYAHGKRLFDLAHAPKTFIQLTGDHNDLRFAPGLPYPTEIAKFLESVRR